MGIDNRTHNLVDHNVTLPGAETTKPKEANIVDIVGIPRTRPPLTVPWAKPRAKPRAKPWASVGLVLLLFTCEADASLVAVSYRRKPDSYSGMHRI
jgi:hypothetical protein